MFELEVHKYSSDKVVLFVPEVLKTTRLFHHLPPIELKTFKDNELCVVAYLKQYIKMTAPFRNTVTNQLLLHFVQPLKPISTTTLSRWCVIVMKESGIYVNIFGSHSTRSESASNWEILGLSSKEIAKSAGWPNEKTFAQFYDRPVQKNFSDYLFRWNLLFLYVCVCMVLFIQETHMGLIIQETILIGFRKILEY